MKIWPVKTLEHMWSTQMDTSMARREECTSHPLSDSEEQRKPAHIPRRMGIEMVLLQEKLKRLEEQNVEGCQISDLMILSRSLQKEFKVNGQIREPGQKDKLTYTSVCQQLEAAIRKEVARSYIVAAVIRCIMPGLPLRS